MHGRSQITVALAIGLALGVATSMTAAVLAGRSAMDPAVTKMMMAEPRATAPTAVAPVSRPRDATAVGASPDTRELAEILARVKREYVLPVDDGQLIESAVRGMVGSLDPYSAYLDRDEYDEIRLSTSGSYPGIGVEVSAEENGIMVLRTLGDSPAARAGIRSGDMIVRIDNRPVELDVEAAIDQMRGPAGTTVTLSLRRPGATDIFDLALARDHVEVHSVARAALEPGYGYLRIASFTDTTPTDVERAIADFMAEQRAPLKGLVIDLRNNPGGVLESAVEVADSFLERGVIVTADGRSPEARFRMDATPGDLLRGARLVVLVNGGSASAAEILAGALRDQKRATLVGRRTYGKGSVQTVIPLANGRALKLTTSYYSTPSGAVINERGIEPDVLVDGVEEPPAELDAGNAASLLQRDREVRLALQTLKSGARLAALQARQSSAAP
jgi:carboxyl-terminal processing protease